MNVIERIYILFYKIVLKIATTSGIICVLDESENSSHPGHRASVKMASAGVNRTTRRRAFVVGVGMTKVSAQYRDIMTLFILFKIYPICFESCLVNHIKLRAKFLPVILTFELGRKYLNSMYFIKKTFCSHCCNNAPFASVYLIADVT